MVSDGSCLGVCYTENQLFYSVNNPEQEGRLTHIGSVEYNFDIKNSIISGSNPGFPAIQSTLREIKNDHHCSSIKILSPTLHECWSVVPRSVYDDASEREAHIQLFMNGYDRSKVQITWFGLSNEDNRLLLIRNDASMKGYRHLVDDFKSSEFVSEFEVGLEWKNHQGENGTYMMMGCHQNYISLSSFILGKLRGCTYIQFDTVNDLPYLWNLYASAVSWMSGIHDDICVYGPNSEKAANILKPFLEDADSLKIMDSLHVMEVTAREKTYGFDLECAFPAILMSINSGVKAL